MWCHQCRSPHPATHRYCSQCGRQLAKSGTSGAGMSPSDRADREGSAVTCGHCGQPVTAALNSCSDWKGVRGERRVITILFTDLSGYTSLSERLDPEEIKDLLSRIYGEIADIVTGYEGFIDKFIGDAAMILFGVPRCHEDDPIRAVRTAVEIHRRIEALGRRMIDHLQVPLQMHSGINTGWVVVDQTAPFANGICFTGDAINVASRLEGMARPGEILVGPDTFAQVDGFFNFNRRPPTRLKGKSGGIPVYQLLAGKKTPNHFRGQPEGRSRLVGRKNEIKQLHHLFRQVLDTGRQRRVSIIGEAGLGKSRLAEEFKHALPADHTVWLEGRAFALSHQQPYSVFTDLLNRRLDIDGSGPGDLISGRLKSIMGERWIQYPDALIHLKEMLLGSTLQPDGMSPESRKEQLYQSARILLKAIVGQNPTVMCLDDLQWADPSSIDLLAYLYTRLDVPLLLVGLSRPNAAGEGDPFGAVLGTADYSTVLADLSPPDSFAMVETLLNGQAVDPTLHRIISEKAEGNPFYIEELINSLIETGILVQANDRWRLSDAWQKLKIPTSVIGTISGRLDRLNLEVKQILKEAAVIGRIFPYRILNRISSHQDDLSTHLQFLLRRNLITLVAEASTDEYRFKHALTQEVVYQRMLRKERRDIHERIGRTLEQLAEEAAAPIYEALAFHYSNGHSLHKAIHYMIKSGQKCLGQYCLEEAHRHFDDAYALIHLHSQDSDEHRRQLVDLINNWAFVFYYRGRYDELLQLLQRHRHQSQQIDDPPRTGMYRAWLGCALWHREDFKQAHAYMKTALEAGEKAGDRRLIGYACAWMTWIETELGRFDQAIAHASRAQESFGSGVNDPYIYINSLAGMGYAYWHRGDQRQTRSAGRRLLAYARHHSENRSRVMGYCCIGWSHLIDGKTQAAARCFKKAVSISTDPWYAVFPKLALSYGLILNGREDQAAELIEDILRFHKAHGAEFAGGPADFFRGLIDVSNRRFNSGLARMQARLQQWHRKGSRLRYTCCALILAVAFSRLAQCSRTTAALIGLRSPLFYCKTMRVARIRAMETFRAVIHHAAAIGADNVLGQAYLNWALLWRTEGNRQQAERCLAAAVRAFGRCGADGFTRKAIRLCAVGEGLNGADLLAVVGHSPTASGLYSDHPGQPHGQGRIKSDDQQVD